MKKLTALVLALVMLLALGTAAYADAEEAPMKTLSWMSARRGILQAEITGSFYQIGDLDCDIWVPDLLEPMEPSEYSYCAFGTADGVPILSVNRISFEGDPTLEEVEEMVPDWGGTSDGIFWINNIYTLVYETESEDTLSAIILLTDGGAIEFVFSHVSNQDVYSLASLMLATIQRHTLDIEELALMIEADLTNNWGENHEVRIVDNGGGAFLRILLWDEGIDSETIENVQNWDAFRTQKVGMCNYYLQSLAGLGFNELSVELMYIFPEEALSFLTIQDGEIVYDVFEDAAA